MKAGLISGHSFCLKQLSIELSVAKILSGSKYFNN
jgi:hypothetical protein